MSWAPGTVVMCVDARGADLPVQSKPLTQGEYYTIRLEFRNPCTGNQNVHLGEVVVSDTNPVTGMEVGFRKERFRIAESTHCESAARRKRQEA